MIRGSLLSCAGLKRISVLAVINRACACGQANDGSWTHCPACARPTRRDSLGRVASWHRNPLIRLWRKLTGG